MIRLHSYIPEPPPKSQTAAQSLLATILSNALQDPPIPTTLDFHSLEPPKDLKEFFDDHYARESENHLNHPRIEQPLTPNEHHLVSYLLNPKAPPIYLLKDHAGKGKSTILRYLCFYLWHKEPGLFNTVLPIYISTKDHPQIDSFDGSHQIYHFIDKRLKTLAFPLTDGYLKQNFKAVAEWANSHMENLQGNIDEEEVARIHREEGVDKFLAAQARADSLRQEQQDTATYYSRGPSLFTRLHLATLSYYSIHERAVVILLDDADRENFDTQRALLEYLQARTKFSFRSVFSIRHSTYEALEAMIRDKDWPESPEIVNSPSKMKSILTQRLEYSTVGLDLRTDSLHSSNTQQDIVDAFIDMVSAPAVADLLVKTSNENLHTLFRKLKIIPSSWYYSDEYILSEILRSATPDDHRNRSQSGIRLWVAIALLLGNYRGTFRSQNDMARAGLINVFCVRERPNQPYAYFTRLHLLSALTNNTTEDCTKLAKDLQADYASVFDYDLSLNRSFLRSLFRLTQGKLLFTKSFRRYQMEDEISSLVETDSLFLAPAGQFYLQTLFRRIDYLYFVKDDINWPENTLDDLPFSYVDPKASREKKFADSLRALTRLAELEHRMLRDILHSPKQDGRVIQFFNEQFSARRVGFSSGLYTDALLQKYLQYFARLNYRIPAKIVDDLNAVLSRYQTERSVFGYPSPESALEGVLDPGAGSLVTAEDR